VDLAIYLKTLLYNHDSVNIPGLGTLITRYKHAEINDSDRTISPPSKFIVFEHTNLKNDSLLQNLIAFEKKVNKKEAAKELSEIINELIKKLNEGETVLLEGIGYFSKEDDIVRFERVHEINFLTESFGLTKIDYRPIENEFIPHIPEIILPKAPKSYKTLIYSLFFIVLIGGCIVLYLNYPDFINLRTKKISRPSIRPIIDTSIVNTKKIVDTLEKKTDIEKFYESSTEKKNALSIPEQKVATQNKYYIIAGSFLTQAKAETMAQEIEKDGYKTQIISFGDKIRISLGEFSDKEKALTELQKIRYTKGDNTVWLLTVPITSK
jgi:nucleoid DNA-binding protein